MNCRCAAAGLSLIGLLSLAPGQASCSAPAARPLQLALAPSYSAAPRANAGSEFRPGAQHATASPARRSTAATQAEHNLRQRALQSMLNAPDSTFIDSPAAIGPAMPQFRFERQGPAIRDFSRSYKEVCAKVSRKIWDEPNGRRIKFDVAGKPGVGMEFPIR